MAFFYAVVSSPASAATLRINDPATSSGYAVTSYTSSQIEYPDISIIGVYETRSDHSAGNHPQGTANVHVRYNDARPMIPLVLLLSSYEPTRWILDRQPEANISTIILNGVHPQEVVNNGGVPVVNKSGAGNYIAACAYAWPSSSGGCDTPGLVDGVQDLVGTPISSFAGVYRATDFTVTGVPVPEPTSIVLSAFAFGSIFIRTRRCEWP